MGFKSWLEKKAGVTDLKEQFQREIEEARERALKAEEEAKAAEEAARLAKEKAEESKMSAKELATKRGEPYIEVLDVKVNKENIRNGFFELDWNNEFVECLIDAGYKGESAEEIVDAWFTTIVSQMLSDQGMDPNRGMGYINVAPLGNGKSEAS